MPQNCTNHILAPGFRYLEKGNYIMSDNPEFRLLISCPPFVKQKQNFVKLLEETGYRVHWVDTAQSLTEGELVELIPDYDAWIVGDDPCTRRVLKAGKNGNLKVVIKWGVGTDNIDLQSIKDFDLKFANTPGLFGKDVADLVIAYVTILARSIFQVHTGVSGGLWPKIVGNSLTHKTIGIVGLGDIGSNISKRALAAEMKVIAYEIDFQSNSGTDNLKILNWPEEIELLDFLVLACPLTNENYMMMNPIIFSKMKRGSFLINVSRGGLIDEHSLVNAIREGIIAGAALDVFNVEPLPLDSQLRNQTNIILGSHNASNTLESVRLASYKAIELVNDFLKN